MIRRDYLLRIVEQCIQALTRSLGFVENRQFDLAQSEVNTAIHALAGMEVSEVMRLSESELTAALLQNEPTQILPQKTLLLVALLQRAGDISNAQSKPDEAQTYYLKALHLQLKVLLMDGDLECPSFVPKVQTLVAALGEAALSPATESLLMQYFERTGEFGKAEDILFRLLEDHAENEAFAEFGIRFYQRLLQKSDEALEVGNLPRHEVESGLAELKERLSRRVS